jgi:hypothetical protein
MFLPLIFFSCQKNTLSENYTLRFSADTIYFDTVFATIGSVTKELRVKNAEKQKIIIDEIYLAGGNKSQFRLNIDGEPAYSRQNVEIDAGDSVFIFVDVNVNPANQDSPVAVTDSVMFRTAGNTYKVHLLAWGQNINLIENKVIGSQTWRGVKPYVIYGNVLIDTLQTLTIEAGSRIYFHRNSSMTVAGSFVVQGSQDSMVTFAGDRLEKMYDDIPGQWLGFSLLNVSSGNKISHALIKNSINGVSLGESVSNGLSPDLEILNSSILHSTVSCLSAIHGKITAANCIFSHTGKYCISLVSGGDYSFTFCTVYDLWDYGFRLTPSVYVYEQGQSGGGYPGQVNLALNNCAIYGDMISELDIVPAGNSFTGNYFIDHCLLKLDTLHASFWSDEIFPGAIVNKDPRFIDPADYDFRPDTLSPLIGNGNPLYSTEYPFDYRGESRTRDSRPDIGAFERIPGEHAK